LLISPKIFTTRKYNTNNGMLKGEVVMGRRRGIMSNQMKEELAKELGFYDVVQQDGWGGIKAKDAGNMVKKAIEIAEQQLANKNQI